MKTQKQINLEFVTMNSEVVANEIANQLTKSYMIAQNVTEDAIYKAIAKRCGQFRYDLVKECKRRGFESFVESCAMDAMKGIVTAGHEMDSYEYLRASARRQAINL